LDIQKNRKEENMASAHMDMEAITQQLYEAVQRHKVCSVTLVNEPLPRIVHPYGVCQLGKKKIVIVCWQESGLSAGNKSSGYRNLSLLKCTHVELQDRHFIVRNDFNPLDGMYTDWVFHI
jgi:hypothetical protein